MLSIRKRRQEPRGSRPRWRRRLRRWCEDFDPWSPRPSDYILGSLVFLFLALAYVGERSHAVQLNRRLYALQERASTLAAEVELLDAEVTRLADRQRIVELAAELGMKAPAAADVEYIYFVANDGGATNAP